MSELAEAYDVMIDGPGTKHKEVHSVCVVCHPDGGMALCGTNVADCSWAPDEADATCMVCAFMDEQDCPDCGQ